jgi:Signal peptidase, peptidase S26
MQCPSCQFENMPGSGRCARCGGMLALAAMAIDVHPPRATRLSRSMPRAWGRFWSARRTLENFRTRAAVPFHQLFERFDDTDFSLNTMLGCFIPGLAHRLRGNVYRGRMFLISYLAFLLPGLLLLGTYSGSILLGLAFATHVASASDALVGRFATAGDRLGFTFACAATLAIAIYVPIGMFASRFAVPITLNEFIPPFAEGDVLWYDPSANISPGDYVLYAVPEMSLGGDHTRFVFRNQWINRVVAVGGQRVQLKDGKLYVDNAPSTSQPLHPTVQHLTADFIVPENSVLIPPEALLPFGARVGESDWQKLSTIAKSRVAGRIFFRSQPLSRISNIQSIENGIE